MKLPGTKSPIASAGLTLSLLVVCFSSPLMAYVGPGAGIAFVSSFFFVLIAFLLAFLALLTWPFRWLLATVRGRKAIKRRRTTKVVVVGLDGQDPELTEEFMKQGLLPNFMRLQEMGSYRRLGTTLPAESPVAWSSFQTGCNPGRHRVFDFLTPNRKTYLPELCSARVKPPSRSFKVGRYRFPIGRPQITFGRKSQSFWKTLGQHGVFSSILRVPITFPPEKFNGVLLSAMSVPDLRGTQGTFSYYSSDRADQGAFTGGIQIPVQNDAGIIQSYILGPDNPLVETSEELRLPFEVQLTKNNGYHAQLLLGNERHPLRIGEYSPWTSICFRPGLGTKIRGMARFFLRETEPHFKMYMSPLNIDPEKPALPISHPPTYSMYLAKTLGRFCTLGLAEDTWALNERVIDEQAFLDQSYLIHTEREKMFFDALEKTTTGAVVCVFDITDRVQHMFYRYLDPGHPANDGKDSVVHRDEIRKLYQRMDRLVGQVLDKVSGDTVLFVMSDHGFKPFKRGVNLNSWLHQNGFLAVHQQPTGTEWFRDVDWAKTKAYAVGLGGIYLNLSGRESQGIVQPGQEQQTVKKEIAEGLERLIDPVNGSCPVAEVYDTNEVFAGPYVAEAPDLIVGFKPGYRVSWTCATGAVDPEIIEDNCRSWSGDHCMNPPDVPGILFSNRSVKAKDPSIIDIGPTILDLFGVPIPSYCDGESILPSEREEKGGSDVL